jgi:hypothetical protein
MDNMNQNELKIRMRHRNIFLLTGNGKYLCNGNTFFCKTLPNAKHLQKLGTFELGTIRKKRKIYVPYFHSKIEAAKGVAEKNYFHDDTILVAAFP